MRRTALAALLVTLLLAPHAEAAQRRFPAQGDDVSERAARAEARSRAVLGHVCRGCGLAGDIRPNRRGRNIAVPSLRTGRRARGTTIYSATMPLPLVSRGEWFVHGSNRVQAEQLQSMHFQQQMQFELNQLRHQLYRHDLFR
jgi:hypothetical protein